MMADTKSMYVLEPFGFAGADNSDSYYPVSASFNLELRNDDKGFFEVLSLDSYSTAQLAKELATALFAGGQFEDDAIVSYDGGALLLKKDKIIVQHWTKYTHEDLRENYEVSMKPSDWAELLLEAIDARQKFSN